jgi:hypothetical protein
MRRVSGFWRNNADVLQIEGGRGAFPQLLLMLFYRVYLNYPNSYARAEA